jgi:hypothetical protein
MPRKPSLRPFPEWARAASVLLLVSVAATSAAQVAPEKRIKLPPPPPDLPGHVNYLARQLYGVALDDSESLNSQIEKLVLDHMGPWLSSHPPSLASVTGPTIIPYDVRVRRELERIFGDLHYPFDARCAAFDKPFGTGEVVGMGYSLGWTEFNRANVIALFQINRGTAQQLAVTHFTPYVDLHFQLLNPPASAADQVWFLAYGTRLGKSHPRLSAILYAYEGNTLQPLWQKIDIYDGRLSFAGEHVVISYLNEDEFMQAVAEHTPALRHEAAYAVGPKGLDLEYER